MPSVAPFRADPEFRYSGLTLRQVEDEELGGRGAGGDAEVGFAGSREAVADREGLPVHVHVAADGLHPEVTVRGQGERDRLAVREPRGVDVHVLADGDG